MKLYYIALQRGRNDAGLLSNLHFLVGEWETGGLSDIIFLCALRHGKYIIDADAGGNLRIYRAYQRPQCFKIRSFGFLHGLSEHLTLALRPVKVGVHQTQSRVSYCLNTIQMVHAAVLQLIGTNTGGIYGFCDKGIDIGKFLITDFDVYTTQHVDGIHNGFPVEGRIIINVDVKIALQRMNSLFVAAQEIRLINLVIIIIFVGNTQIAVAEYRHQTNFTSLFVDAGQHLYIGKRSFSQISITGIYTEYRNGPVAVIPEMEVEKQSCKQACYQDQDPSKMFFLSAFFVRFFVSGTILSHIALTIPPSGIFLLFFALRDGAVQLLLQRVLISIVIIQIQFFNLVWTQIIEIRVWRIRCTAVTAARRH